MKFLESLRNLRELENMSEVAGSFSGVAMVTCRTGSSISC